MKARRKEYGVSSEGNPKTPWIRSCRSTRKRKRAEAENAALLAGRPLGYKEATPEPVIP